MERVASAQLEWKVTVDVSCRFLPPPVSFDDSPSELRIVIVGRIRLYVPLRLTLAHSAHSSILFYFSLLPDMAGSLCLTAYLNDSQTVT